MSKLMITGPLEVSQTSVGGPDWISNKKDTGAEFDDWFVEFSGHFGAHGPYVSAAPDLLDALIVALPYIETAELDEAYKPGAVSKVSKQIRDAIAKAEGKEAPDA